jgi:aspartyl-tRNA(Asn)/glutamyl-tRNA(Gln) amidotransferase subunit B
LPKGYQISQYDLPMSANGWVEISDPKGQFEPKRVGIIRAHLEEDAGKSMHDEAAGRADSRIDLNRTGTPLLEIVTQPDLRSPLEARAFLNELKLLLTYLGVSDCNMEEGSLRVDANVNLHVHTPSGKVPTPIVEVKNVNSFRAVERALVFEAGRQWKQWQQRQLKLGQVPKQTRGWDDKAQVTKEQRTKEDSSDYRYFPDPDLAPVTTTPAQVDGVRSSLGELPSALRKRLEGDYKIPAYDADVIVSGGRSVSNYYIALADGAGDGKLAANWLTQTVFSALKDRDETIDRFPLGPAKVAELLQAVKRGDVDVTRGRDVFATMLESGQSAAEAIQSLGIKKVDDSALETLVKELFATNPQAVADLQAGKMKALGAIIGQAKKKNPNVDPNRVKELCMALAVKSQD